MSVRKFDINLLIGAVELYTEDSTIKKAAVLLIAAMNDWPTLNQTDLYEFLHEFKLEYGGELTPALLKNKSSDSGWKEEAKHAVIEILELYPSKTIDDIIEEILKKYNQ